MKVFVIELALSVILLFSCTEYLTGMISRTYDDPDTNGILRADPFSKVNTVFLSWDEDEATDEFTLYKADNNDGRNFSYEVIYTGSDTSYEDALITTGKLYRYRLDRRRGSKTFTGNVIALGVGASIDDGLNKENSSIESAIELEYKINSCCYYYKFDDATILSNEDYYKVKLPAYKKAHIVITDNTKFDFRYRIPGASSYRLLGPTGSTFEVYNNKEVENYCYFVISANPDNFVTGKTPGGDIRKYRLELSEIVGQ